MPDRLNGRYTSVDNVLVRSEFNVINIDYTISTNKKVFYNKCKKNYQGVNRRLILVSLKKDFGNDILKKRKITNKMNVRIMDHKSFSKFMKYDDVFLKKYIQAIDIMKKSFLDDSYLKRLEKKAKKARIQLEKKSELFPISQEDYEFEVEWWKL